ncbi:MAG: hypothetical protein ABJD13_19560 [Paracoccaceae bacterium]
MSSKAAMVCQVNNLWFVVISFLFASAVTGVAGPQSLFGHQVLGQSSGALIPVGTPGAEDVEAPRRASLFIDRNDSSMFANMPLRNSNLDAGNALPKVLTGSGVVGLRNLIARAEAGRAGYDAVQYGARIKPRKRPTNMTIAEIYQWIRDTPGQPHAIGRYQMIPATLRSLVKRAGVKTSARFTPALQDKLSNFLLEDAGITAFTSGAMNRTTFMNNLAKIWAGLPNSSGQSHYDGYAGNKAVISWTWFEAEIKRIFPS